jgi:drug/metabolite transporter (DMT)-like permease
MNKISKDYWFVVTTGILSGLIVFGGEIFKRLGFSLLELSILVYFPSIIILFPFLKGKSGQIFNGGNLKLLIMWSLFAGLTVITQFGAIMAGAPVALVVLLLYTQPIWTLFISRIFFRAEIKKVDIYALVLVVIGLVLLIQPWEIANFGSVNGTLIGLGGGLALSGWVTMGNYIGKSKIDPYVSKFMETFLANTISSRGCGYRDA